MAGSHSKGGSEEVAKEHELLHIDVADASTSYKWFLNNEHWVIGGFSILVFLGIWEAIGRSGFINPIFLSSPSVILKTGIKINPKQILHDGLITLKQ